MESNISSMSLERNDYKAMVGSVGVALLIMSQNMMQLSSYFFGTTNIFFGVLICFAVVSLLIEHSFVLKDVAVLLCLTGLFFVTRLTANNTALAHYLRAFVIYGLTGFAFSYAPINRKWLFRCVVSIGVIWYVFFFRRYGLTPLDGFAFGYLVFPIVMSSFFCARGEKGVLKVLASILCVIFIALLFMNASRGTIICILLFFIIQYYQKIHTPLEIIIFCLILILFIIAIKNYESVLLYLNQKYPGKIRFVVKSLYLIDSQAGITNGRSSILMNIIKDYTISDYLFGAGIGMFASSNIQFEYTHNLFLSVILEFGLIGIVYLVYLILVFFQTIREKDEYNVFLGCAALLPLQFSGVFWQSFIFWLFVFSMNKRSVIRYSPNKVHGSKYLRDSAY